MKNGAKNPGDRLVTEGAPDLTPDPLEAQEIGLQRTAEALGKLFAECQSGPELFQKLYVEPLVRAGLSVEKAFDLVVEGVLKAN